MCFSTGREPDPTVGPVATVVVAKVGVSVTWPPVPTGPEGRETAVTTSAGIVKDPFVGSKVSTISEHSHAPRGDDVTDVGPEPTPDTLGVSSAGPVLSLVLDVMVPDATRFIIVENGWVPDTLWVNNGGFFGVVSGD